MKKGIDFIQDFRGIAALSVVLYHASSLISPYGQGLGHALFGSAGTMGVDLFFIISGFIMVYATRSADGSIAYTKDFFVRRFARVFPLYAIISTAYYLMCIRYGIVGDFTLNTYLSSILFVPTGGDFGPVYGWPVLNVGWTLNYEMYFYLMFGLSLLFGRAKWLALGAWFIATIFALPIIAGRELNILPSIHYHFGVEYLNLVTNPVILLFLAGVTIGLVYRSRLTIPRLPAAIMVAASIGWFFWQYSTHYRADHGVTMWGLSLIPLVTAFALASKTLTLPSTAITRFLGDISYSLYLVHPLVLLCMARAAVWFGYADIPPGWTSVVAVVAASVIAAVVVNRYIEVRLSNWLRDMLLRIGRRGAAPRNQYTN